MTGVVYGDKNTSWCRPQDSVTVPLVPCVHDATDRVRRGKLLRV